MTQQILNGSLLPGSALLSGISTGNPMVGKSGINDGLSSKVSGQMSFQNASEYAAVFAGIAAETAATAAQKAAMAFANFTASSQVATLSANAGEVGSITGAGVSQVISGGFGVLGHGLNLTAANSALKNIKVLNAEYISPEGKLTKARDKLKMACTGTGVALKPGETTVNQAQVDLAKGELNAVESDYKNKIKEIQDEKEHSKEHSQAIVNVSTMGTDVAGNGMKASERLMDASKRVGEQMSRVFGASTESLQGLAEKLVAAAGAAVVKVHGA